MAGVLCLQVEGHPTVCLLWQVSSVYRLRDILQSVYYGRCPLFTGCGASYSLFIMAGVLCLQVVGHPAVCLLRQVYSACRLWDILQSVY